MLKGILPKEYNFYDFFDKHIALAIELSKELMKITNPATDLNACIKKIKDYEHEMDEITHRCMEALHKTFITPMERSDIHNLIKRLDDIADSVDSAVSRIGYYEITEIRQDVRQIADVLIKATTKISEALKALRDMKNPELIKEKCIAIHELENEGDVLLRQSLTLLFKEKDAILVIKWKEIYERLEKAIDRCEDVANIIEGVVLAST